LTLPDNNFLTGFENFDVPHILKDLTCNFKFSNEKLPLFGTASTTLESRIQFVTRNSSENVLRNFHSAAKLGQASRTANNSSDSPDYLNEIKFILKVMSHCWLFTRVIA
jgi:hypothetical protein